MHNINIIAETIAVTANNAFVGTLFAGILIARFGLSIYEKQKRVDIDLSRKEKLHNLAVDLLTQVNIAVPDYLGQISVHDGTNPNAKAVFNKIETVSPGQIFTDTSSRFAKHIANIVDAQNNLLTPLALRDNGELKVKEIARLVPLLTFLFSTTSALSKLPADSLKDLSEQARKYSSEIKVILSEILKE